MAAFILIALIIVFGAVIFILLAVFHARIKTNGNRPETMKNLDSDQADEIASTWNLLNH